METGTIINQYKIISAIGKGGMGEFFLAQDTKFNRQAALKKPSKEFAEHQDIHAIGESEDKYFI